MKLIRIKIAIYALCVMSITSGILFEAPRFYKKWSENLQATRILEISRGEIVDQIQNECVLSSKIVSYPYLVYCFRNHLLSSDDFNKISGLEIFHGRGKLFQLFRADGHRDNKRYSIACEILTEISSKPMVLTFAKRSYEQGDWPGVRSYLSCLENVTLRGTASVFEIALLYDAIGDHLRQTDMRGAESYYTTAIALYPVTWAEPVLALAEIYFKTDGIDKAINFIATHLKEATQRQTQYLLSQQLGSYYESAQDDIHAYCAFFMALSLGDRLSEDFAPKSVLISLQDKVNAYSYNFEQCKSIWIEISGGRYIPNE